MPVLWLIPYPCHDLDLGDWYWPQNLKLNNHGTSDSRKVTGGSVCNPDIQMLEGGTDADIRAEIGMYTAEVVV